MENSLLTQSTSGSLNSISKFLAWLLVLCAVNQIFIFTPNLPQMVYYTVMIGLNILLITTNIGKPISISVGMWIFWLVMWLSILFNYDTLPAIFQAEERTISFCGVMLALGPWLLCKQLIELRLYIWKALNKCLLVMIMFSFLGRIGGFLPSDNNGYYLGCFAHSMILAPLAALVCLNCLHESVHGDKLMQKRIMGFCSVIALAVLLFASSRTSLVAVMVAVFTYLTYQVSGKSNVIIKNIIFFGIVLCIISFIAGGMLDGIKDKQKDGFDMEQMLQSRDDLWNARLTEIKKSPVFGIGSHSVSAEFIYADGKIEPGNAWLFAFSSMGIFSFLVLLGLVGNSFMQLRSDIKERKRSDSVLLISQVVFWAVYMNGEAHITAAGDFTYLYFWLVIGISLGIYRYLEPQSVNHELAEPETETSK